MVITGCQNESFTLREEITKIDVMKLREMPPSPEDYKSKKGEVIKEINV